MDRRTPYSLLKWELYEEKFKKKLPGPPSFYLYSVIYIVFLSRYLVDGSFAPVVKNADAGDEWAASLLIRVINSAVVNDVLLCTSQHVKAQVSPYTYSRHRGGVYFVQSVEAPACAEMTS